MIKGIDNVGISVSDLGRAIAFYERLGFTKEYDYEADVTGCAMATGSAVLFLFQTKRADAQPVQRSDNLGQNPPGIDHISFLVGNVDRAYADLTAKGVAFLGEPADLPEAGIRLAGVKDPDGNVLYLLQYLK
ncbi:MAG: VOC family protein [Anaerolineae bacterium]